MHLDVPSRHATRRIAIGSQEARELGMEQGIIGHVPQIERRHDIGILPDQSVPHLDGRLMVL